MAGVVGPVLQELGPHHGAELVNYPDALIDNVAGTVAEHGIAQGGGYPGAPQRHWRPLHVSLHPLADGPRAGGPW